MKQVINTIKTIPYLQLVILHVGIGIVLYLTTSVSKLFFLSVLIYFIFKIIFTQNKNQEALIAAAYITGLEVFSRMTGGSLTYEFAKYAVMGFLLFGMFYKGFSRKSYAYIVFLIFLVPGILLSAINLDYESNALNAIGFNLSGPYCLAISAIYCYDLRITKNRLQEVLLAVLLPIIAMTIYLYFYTPIIKDVLIGTHSNRETSGGFGPNQVSTILGLGMFILFSRLLIYKDKIVNLIDVILLVLISYRAIVTFSRGGVLVAGICSIVFLLVYFFQSEKKEKASMLPKIGLIFIVILGTWAYSSVSTMGLIDKRYSNQDAAGRSKEKLTTGRAELLNTELEAFFKHPWLGVGVGKAKEYRREASGKGVATHNEMSRMLSEHGMFGFFALLVLIITPLIIRIKNKSNLYLYSFLLFWFFTINHSSMRIAAPAFIYGLSLIYIFNAKKNTIPRE